MRLLLLEDDRTLGEGLRDYLRSEAHVVDWCTTLAQARQMVDEPYDAWLIDWQLPDGSGLDWVRSIRRQGNSTPVLILTARDLLTDRVRQGCWDSLAVQGRRLTGMRTGLEAGGARRGTPALSPASSLARAGPHAEALLAQDRQALDRIAEKRQGRAGKIERVSLSIEHNFYDINVMLRGFVGNRIGGCNHRQR